MISRIRRFWRSLTGSLRRWEKPRLRRWEGFERGSHVLQEDVTYIIYDGEPNIRTSRGKWGPCLYTAINPKGVLVSLTNWNCKKL